MPLWKNDDFEHQNTAVYSSFSGTPTFDGPAHTGASSIHLNPSASTEHVQYNPPAGNRKVAVSLYVRYETLPGTTCMVSECSGPVAGVRFNAGNGRFELLIAGTIATRISSTTVVADTWYLVDYYVDCSTGTTHLRGRLDHGEEHNTALVQTSVNISAVSLGANNSQTYDGYFDEWKISLDGENDYAVSELGDPLWPPVASQRW